MSELIQERDAWKQEAEEWEQTYYKQLEHSAEIIRRLEREVSIRQNPSPNSSIQPDQRGGE
jgi:hypothetical protein